MNLYTYYAVHKVGAFYNKSNSLNLVASERLNGKDMNTHIVFANNQY